MYPYIANKLNSILFPIFVNLRSYKKTRGCYAPKIERPEVRDKANKYIRQDLMEFRYRGSNSLTLYY